MIQGQKKLMIPGPVEVSPEVLCALSSQIKPHYGAEWVEDYGRVIAILKKIFNTTQDVFLIAGSGTCAIDACIGSSLQTGDQIIIGNNGFFGDRLVSVAEANGLQVVEVKVPWGEKITPDMIEDAIQANPDAKAVAMVHCETSTTIINPVDQIGQLTKDLDVLYIVDAVSSLGGIPYHADKWGIDLCASATQKCLGAPPGLAPVSVSQKAWQRIERTEHRSHGWYTNLEVWRRYAVDWADWHPTPVTMPSSIFYALLVALEQLMAEGIEDRLMRYRNIAIQLRQGLREAGMQPFTTDDNLNPVLTAAYPPVGNESSDVVEYLLNRHQIQISGGLGDLKKKIFRIGHMSPVLSEDDITRLVMALKQFDSGQKR